MRARVCSRNAARDSVGTRSAAIAIVGRERGRRGFQLAALVEDLDPALGLFEARVTEARQLDAALVELQRLLEREVAFFQLLHDAFELGDRRLEILDRRVRHEAPASLPAFAAL